MAVFEKFAEKIDTEDDAIKPLKSDGVLAVLSEDLISLGFDVETGKRDEDKVKRPVSFGENAVPELQYQVDAWHQYWKAGLEIEAGRAWLGNAVYRDLIQAFVMVDLEHLLLAVPKRYRYSSGSSPDYKRTVAVADALYRQSRTHVPFSLCLIGY